jgi:4-aminobutyrate--pyruvate transaminase
MTSTLGADDLDSVLHPVTNFRLLRSRGPLVIVEGSGICVRDDHGREYIDSMAGLWCTALGHGVRELADAAHEQISRLAYSPLFAGKSHEPAIRLAQKLKTWAPHVAGKVFFGSTGSDANDTQVKLVRYYNNAVGRPRKKKIISRTRGYHGVTIASASLTGLPVNHALFDLPMPGVVHVECPHHYRFAEPGVSEESFATRLAASLEKRIIEEDPDTVAAFIAEPVMGAGGVIVPPRTYFEKVQAVLDRYDIMLIDDEVICGFGRLGCRFGAEYFGMRPKTMSVAKAITSGYVPLSAVFVPDDMYEAFIEPSAANGSFGHGFTYSGHPVACAVALRNLELMEQRNVVAHAHHVGARFQSRLRGFGEHALAGEARGVGLIGALELVADKRSRAPFAPVGKVGLYCSDRCEDQGLIVRNIGDVIAFCPPLVITESEIDEMFDRFSRALDATASWVTNGMP